MVLALRVRATVASAAAASLIASACPADPLPFNDQNPLLSGFALPAALPTRLNQAGGWSFQSTFSWASSAIVQASDDDSLVVDAETKELRLVLQRGLAHGYAMRIQLPYRHTSGGSLDGFIDRWHDTFGLPEGARPSLPEDALRLLYVQDGVVRMDSRSSTQGLGDASVELGKALVQNERSAVTGWLGLKLPTGDADDLTGSGSVDVTVALAAEHRLGERWQLFGQVAGTWLSEGDRLSRQQCSAVGSATAGMSVRAIGELTLTVQVDAHTAVYDANDLEFLDDAVALSVGGSYRFGADWALAFGVSEDIAVESAPDVVFLFDLKKTF